MSPLNLKPGQAYCFRSSAVTYRYLESLRDRTPLEPTHYFSLEHYDSQAGLTVDASKAKRWPVSASAVYELEEELAVEIPVVRYADEQDDPHWTEKVTRNLGSNPALVEATLTHREENGHPVVRFRGAESNVRALLAAYAAEAIPGYSCEHVDSGRCAEPECSNYCEPWSARER